MPVNKIGAGTNLYPPMTIPLAGGQTYLLPGGQGIWPAIWGCGW